MVVLIDVQERVFHAVHDRHFKVVGRRYEFFDLLIRENVQGKEVALGVTVLTRLRRRDVENLGWSALNNLYRA